MESKIIFCEKVFIPLFKEYPFEATEAWGVALRNSMPKRQKAILKAVPNAESFFKKIGVPTLDNIQKMLSDDFISKCGLTKDQLIRILNRKFSGKKLARTYRKNLRSGLKTFDQGELNSAMVGYHRAQCFGEYRFREPLAITLGYLIPLLIIQPGKEGEFISKFYNQLISSGILISDLQYDPEYIKPENDKIKRLINEYLRKEIVPFATGGKSRCDFVLIKDSVTPTNSKEIQEIKYEIYKHFYGLEHANKLRAAWTVMDESTPPDPNDYLGNHIDPSKQAYFNMYLDIQVSQKD